MSEPKYKDLNIPMEQTREMPMVDLAFLVLKAANTPFYYRDLMVEVAKYKGFSEEEIRGVIAQLYTEINVDGRFACVGNNLWGLKRWYPVDNKADDALGGKRPRIINDEEDDIDEEDSYQEEEDNFAAEEDEFDSFDEDREEIEEEEEEEEFFPDEEEDESAEDAELDEEADEAEEEEEDEDSFEGDDEDED